MTRDREERIRARAMEIWMEEGRPEGRAREHWEQAEREIGEEAVDGVPGSTGADAAKQDATKSRTKRTRA